MKAGGLAARAAVLLALIALVLGGGWCAVFAGVATLLVLVPPPALPPALWLALHAAVLLASGLGAVSAMYKEALAGLVSWLVVHRAWTGSTAGDARVALLFATLLALLACLQTESLSLGVALVAFSALLPAALLRVEVGPAPGLGWRAAAAGLLVIVLGSALFFVLPRLRGGYFAVGGGTGGRGSTVTLGDDSGSPTAELVARVRVSDRSGRTLGGPFYLRGRALDRFDGHTWTTSLGNPDPSPPVIDGELASAEMRLEPSVGGLLLGPPETLTIEGLGGPAWRDQNGAWHHRRGVVPLEYVARFRRTPGTEMPVFSDRARDAWLALPELDPRILPLAWTIAPTASDPRQIAEEMTAFLTDEFLYVESPATPRGDPLATFLFETRRGHCEYFASALAVLLRVRGVPARLATGFYTDEREGEDGWYVARASHAHAWVEVPLASGWASFDPSPLGAEDIGAGRGLEAWFARLQDRWVRLVVEYDLGDQFDGLAALGDRFASVSGQGSPAVPARAGLQVLFVGLVVLYGGAVLVQLVGTRALVRGPRGPSDALAKEVAAARRLVERRGYAIPPGLPARAAAEWLLAEVGPAAEPFGELVELSYAARYGGVTSPETFTRARACVAALRAIPTRRAAA